MSDIGHWRCGYVIIIYAAKELNFVARFGYDHREEELFDQDVDVAKQVGAGKTFPGSLYCEYHGKRIPDVVAVSPKECMASEILVTALDRFDELGVFPRTSGSPIPCVLFDAHNILLQVSYLARVNHRIIDDDSAWMSSIGLPNGTTV